MREYLSKSIFQYSRIPTALDLKAEGFASRPLSPGESTVERAYLLAAMGRPLESRAILVEGAKTEPAHPGLYEVEGLLLDREQKPAEALAAFGKAVELGSKRARCSTARLSSPARPRAPMGRPTRRSPLCLKGPCSSTLNRRGPCRTSPTSDLISGNRRWRLTSLKRRSRSSPNRCTTVWPWLARCGMRGGPTKPWPRPGPP